MTFSYHTKHFNFRVKVVLLDCNSFKVCVLTYQCFQLLFTYISKEL